MNAPLNLASRPFRNEKLPALLLGLGTVALLALTVQHARVIGSLLPARTSSRHQQVAALDKELAELREQATKWRRAKPADPTTKDWAMFKNLVDRRAFSWTDLFADLEGVLPPGVKLLSIAPGVEGGEVKLDLEAVARRGEDALAFAGLLQKRPEFIDATILGIGDDGEGGATVSYETRYLPARRGARP